MRAVPLLAAFLLISAATVGPAPDGSPVVLTCLALWVLCSSTKIGSGWLSGVTVTAFLLVGAGGLAFGQTWTSVLTDLAVMLPVTLLGLNRRQHHVLAAEQARAAALDERTRIARELHDVLAHSLGALGMQLEVAEALLSERGDVDGALLRVRRSRRLAQDGLVEARGAVSALRDDVPSLVDALGQLVADFRRDRLTEVHFDVKGIPREVSTATAVSLQRTAREALTNAAKHAPGADVRVLLEYRAEVIRLRISNSAPPVEPNKGFGLTGMRERLALAGGTLAAGPVGTEWLVTSEVPQ